MQVKIDALSKLNKQLSPPEELCGVFLPYDVEEKRDDVLLLAKMPSMSEPKEKVQGPYNFNVTADDRFFQEMLVKHGLSGIYATDIVKCRDKPRKPTEEEVESWLPFLKKELSILSPRIIIVIGKGTYCDIFLPLVEEHLDGHFQHDYIFQNSHWVKPEEFEDRLREVVTKNSLFR